ncbi:MAG TPA: deoxynucleoside kinase [Bacteroidales bacterium]|nr:deoxynucleoside kinase [Bacteroidales bacterium]
MKYQYICIEGNIGAGKTSLAEMLAEEYNGKLVLEQFADNPFLPRFYEDPSKYAFPLELSFLASRYQQLKDHTANPDLFNTCVVADYFLSKSLIFARKTLAADEYSLFSKLFNIIIGTIPKPDILIYLHLNVDRLQSNIRRRGRDYEKNIADSYLEKLQDGYMQYLKTLPDTRIVMLDTNNIDFVGNTGDYQRLLSILNKDFTAGIHRFTF